MQISRFSVRRIITGISAGVILTVLLLLAGMYAITENPAVIYSGLILTVAVFLWGGIFLYVFQKKLSGFTAELCRTLDVMLEGTQKLEINTEEETLLSRISYRLERLYDIMQENRLRAEKEKRELQILVSDISHQTKTPIANLKMINDTLLIRSMPEEKKVEFLHAAGSQLEKLEFMIHALVKTSRLETGLITLEKKTAPIYETLVAAINGILALLEKKQLKLTIDCEEELSVSHDIRWTSEALFNILENSVKYTSDCGSIGISVQEWEMYVKIDVKDTGKGIPEHEQGAVFKRFYRGEAVQEIEGIGIGLYLARTIITMQGGYIKVASTVGKGSVFSIFLPRR